MCLFNIQKEVKSSKKLTLLQMAESRFGDDSALMEEIKLFLKSCRQKKFFPSKVSWKAQCEILEKIPSKDRVKAVHNSVVKGYRQIAYADNVPKVTREKVKQEEIINIGF